MGNLSIQAAAGSAASRASGGMLPPEPVQAAVSMPRYDRYGTAQEAAPKTILEAMREAREQAEETAKKFKLKSNVRYGDLPLEAYARLRRARTKSDAAAAAGYARRCLSRLQAAVRRDDEKAGEIRCAMRQLEKVAARANRKKRDIDRERLMQLRRRRAAEQQRQREAVRLHAELQRRRAVRTIREGSYLQETAIAQGMQAYQDAMKADMAAQFQQVTGGESMEFSAQA